MSYGYYRAFNTMLDHVQVLHDMALKAAKGNRFKELKKGTSASFVYIHVTRKYNLFRNSIAGQHLWGTCTCLLF